MKHWWKSVLMLVILSLTCAASGCGGNVGTTNPDTTGSDELRGELLRDTSGAPSGVRLTWPRVNDTTVTGYHVYKASSPIPDSARGDDTYWVEFDSDPVVPQVAQVTPDVTVDDLFSPAIGEMVYYRLASINAAGEESRLSPETVVEIMDFVITNLNPTTAGIGETFTVEGQYFGQYNSTEDFVYIPGVDWLPGTGFVASSVPATISNWAADAIDVSPTLGTTTGPVTVTVGGSSKMSTQTFTNSDPYITDISTLNAAPGTEVMLTGNNFGTVQDGTHRVVVGGTELTSGADYVIYTNTSIVFRVPSVAAAQYPIRVRVDSTNSNEAYLEIGSIAGPIWEHTWGESAIDVANAVVTDDTGNVYVSGYSNSYHTPPFDVLLTKYDADGNWQWGRVWDNTSHATVTDREESSDDMCIDSANNLYLCGSTMDTGVQQTALLLKYDSDGNHQFTSTWGTGSAAWSFGHAVCCDATNVYVAGVYQDTVSNVFVARFNLSDGALTDDGFWDLSNNQWVNDIVVDGNGDLVLTGYTTDVFGTGLDMFVLKLNTDLTLIWADYWGTSTGDDSGYCLYTDAGNNIYIGGGSSGFSANWQPIVVTYNSTGTMQADYTWPIGFYSKFIMIDQAASGNFICVGTGYSLDDTLYYAVLGDTALDVLEFRHYTDDVVLPGALGGWLDSSDNLYICGLAPSLGAAWDDETTTTTAVTASTLAETMSWEGYAGVSANPAGTTTNVTGTLDTGGGVEDTLIIKYNPE